MTNNQKEELGHLYYVVHCLTAKEAAKKVGVSENTFGKWVAKNGWKEMKAAEAAKTINIIAGILDDIIAIRETAKKENRILNASERDGIKKLTSAIKDLKGDYGLEVYDAVLREYVHFTRIADLSFTQKNIDLIETFLKQKSNQLKK